MSKLKQELDAQRARLIIDGLTDDNLVESILITAIGRKTELRIGRYSPASKVDQVAGVEVPHVAFGESGVPDLGFSMDDVRREVEADIAENGILGDPEQSAHDKALDVVRAALEGFTGSDSEHADLFVTTYAAALKVVAA